MEKSDGYLKTTKHQKTRILPLRWIGNICGEISSSSLVKVWNLYEDDNIGYRYKFHGKVWKYLNKPYKWWGTYYILHLDAWKIDPDTQELLGRLGSDYDEDGIAYWEKYE